MEHKAFCEFSFLVLLFINIINTSWFSFSCAFKDRNLFIVLVSSPLWSGNGAIKNYYTFLNEAICFSAPSVGYVRGGRARKRNQSQKKKMTFHGGSMDQWRPFSFFIVIQFLLQIFPSYISSLAIRTFFYCIIFISKSSFVVFSILCPFVTWWTWLLIELLCVWCVQVCEIIKSHLYELLNQSQFFVASLNLFESIRISMRKMKERTKG